ncbi:MAG TPA: BlaI/MecI/CopY family transcriptional regulator [Dinghuibacter sp.]|jgi:predicted transcriptional regulator|uniref:BlaI/MecI/CopY family transcriptional regulator n=1 Tax=Dinghuibacter sp. TaxID=2024697 RepID=UPI002B6BA544|nr:BlaI/MecI/CopY family transcriptional regulator [Dinghuibacter sp.]HTJ11334.1 BlaI/MecI/CopY family transcriptional regulator [Dinghuibacter sp.]
MGLSKAEEELMEHIWSGGAVFMKDLLDRYPDPKPASTTVATLLKRMSEKGYVGYKVFGNSRQYYPLVSKNDYFSRHLKNIVENYFDNSTLRFASFFTQSGNMTPAELEALKKIIEDEIQKQGK